MIPGNGVKENCVDDPPHPPDLDKDNDGVNDDIDCDDNNPAINQRAKEIRGNSVDEDCVGGPQDYDTIRRATARHAARPCRPLQVRPGVATFQRHDGAA